MGGVEAPARGWAPGTSTPDHQHSGPRANGYPRLAHHRPIQSVYWHCPKAPPECINRPADAFWHLCILPRRLASALSVLLSFTLLRLNLRSGNLHISSSCQAACRRRRRAKARTPPQAAIRPGSRAPTIGPGEAVRDDRWNAVPISNYRRLDELRGLITANCRRKRTAVEL